MHYLDDNLEFTQESANHAFKPTFTTAEQLLAQALPIYCVQQVMRRLFGNISIHASELGADITFVHMKVQ